MTVVQKTSHGRLFRAILVAMASVAGLGLLAANLSPSIPARSGESNRPLTATGSVVVAPRATMEIIPAAVIDKDALRFIGTGDGSGGSWVP